MLWIALVAQTFGTPVVDRVTPTEGRVGTVVTVYGNNFGYDRGTTVVWIGSKPGDVVSWSETQIVAKVASGASSGVVQVRHGTIVSNSVRFSVAGPTITSVSPSSGGSRVTVTGFGFGVTQGSGKLYLGTAVATVVSWTETQIVAIVAPGADSSTAQVLQDGQIGNAVPFRVAGAPPHLREVTPRTAARGSVVSLGGSAFGATQGSGVVTIGGVSAQVRSWSDTVIAVIVPADAVSGTIRVQQSGKWSEPGFLSVGINGVASMVLNPHYVTMAVGTSRSLQALDEHGKEIRGLSWRSSDARIVSLSSDDPPLLTAHAPGTATITAGSASAEVLVYGRQ